VGGPLSGGYSRGARKSIDFSDHYYKTSAVIVAYKSMDINGSPESLAGKIIGVQASTIHLAYANAHVGDAAEIQIGRAHV
jgi:polar amino acid transport system substrate-binding protein